MWFNERLHRCYCIRPSWASSECMLIWERFYFIWELFCTGVDERLYDRSQSQWTLLSGPEEVTDVHHRQQSDSKARRDWNQTGSDHWSYWITDFLQPPDSECFQSVYFLFVLFWGYVRWYDLNMFKINQSLVMIDDDGLAGFECVYQN